MLLTVDRDPLERGTTVWSERRRGGRGALATAEALNCGILHLLPRKGSAVQHLVMMRAAHWRRSVALHPRLGLQLCKMVRSTVRALHGEKVQALWVLKTIAPLPRAMRAPLKLMVEAPALTLEMMTEAQLLRTMIITAPPEAASHLKFVSKGEIKGCYR